MRLWSRLVLVVSVFVCGWAVGADYSAAGPREVAVLDGTWTDSSRLNREVPYRIYWPKDAAGACPIVIFSHGLGGNCKGYEYFGRQVASWGYVSVHIQHHGSDTDAIRDAVAKGEKLTEAMARSAANLQNALARPADVSFAIDQLERANTAPGDLKGKLDLGKIAIAGHSFGGFTAMAIAGQTSGRFSFRDKRVSAAIAMSAPAPKGRGSYAQVDIPVLVMTGTLDDSPILGGTAESRTDAFDQFALADRYLLVFAGGDHMVFSGSPEAFTRAMLGLPGMAGDRKRDPEFQGHIKAVSVAFLDAYLENDAQAREWLKQDEGAKASLGAAGTFKAVLK